MGIDVKLEWYGKQRTSEIRARFNNGMIKATKFLWRQIKNEISEWGSEFLSSLKRKRTRHSSAGDPPLKQTGNLEKSIDFKFVWGEDGYINGLVFSDAPYAETLERGGTLQVDQSEKKHTRVRLVNPIRNAISIAARPFMAPTLRKHTERIIAIIQRG
jgi:hypothetical protein